MKIILALLFVVGISGAALAGDAECSPGQACLPGSSGSSDNVDGKACAQVTNQVGEASAADNDPVRVATTTTGTEDKSGDTKKTE